MAPKLARAEFYLHSWSTHHEEKGSLSIAPEFLFYSTQSNFDELGNDAPIAGLDVYTRTQADATLAYGLTSDLTVYARLSWARAVVNASPTVGENFGFMDQSVGANYRLLELKDGGALDLQAQVDVPMYDNRRAAENGSVFLGDGSTDMTAGGHLILPLLKQAKGSWLLNTGAGFTYRTNEFSSAIPWSASIEYARRRSGLRLGLGAYGVASLRTDPKAETGPLDATAAGSFVVNAVNPSHITGRATAGYDLNSGISFFASVGRSVWGQASPVGWSGVFGAQARFGAAGSAASPARLSAREYGKSNQGFINYEFEARVLRTNDRLNLVKLDKGRQQGVAVGQVFDVFSVKKDGSLNEAIARGKITAVKDNEAVLGIEEYFKEVWIEERFIVKRPMQ